MKKYNCFEELKEQFSKEYNFICEGKTFEFVNFCKFRVDTPLNKTIIKNAIYGISISVYSNYLCTQYYYRSI